MTITTLLLISILVTGIVAVAGVVLLVLRMRKLGGETGAETAEIAKITTELQQAERKIGELEQERKEVQSQKDELIGKNKRMFAENTELQANLRSTTKEKEDLQKKLARVDAEGEKRAQEQKDAIQKLQAARESLDDEKMRVRREDEERKAAEEQNRDRIWAEHERTVVSLLTDLVKKQQYSFTSYDNTNLPEGFHGSLKPDFLIEFLDQFIVFDAKVSKQENMQTYITDQVKKTATKVKGKEKIYPWIFLVVPSAAIGEIRKMSYYEEGFTFFVVSPESLEPILASLKRIASYEFAQEMNPQERENIVDLLAQLDFHISTRNAVDWHLLQHGIETLAKAQRLDPDIAREVAVKKAKIRNLNFNSADLKQLTANPGSLQGSLLELVEPRAIINKEELERVKNKA